MRPATKRLLAVASLLLVVWAVSSAVALAAGWPARFGEGHGDTNDLAQEFLDWGTAVSPPGGVMIALAVFALLAPLRGFSGALGIGGPCCLSVATSYLSLGYLVSSHHAPYVPDTMLAAVGVVGGLLSAALLPSGIAELVDRGRAERRIPRPG